MSDDIKRFLSPDYLISGNYRQKRAYRTLKGLEIFKKLKPYGPVLAGTIPIEIDIEGSDLDILCSFRDANSFKQDVTENFAHFDHFSLKEKRILDEKTIIARFQTEEFPVEIFAQNVPTTRQHAFIHMINEYRILKEQRPEFKKRVIELKRSGMKTEPAFALLLGVTSDPYQWLLSVCL